MLTDEQLAELEAAVDAYGVYERVTKWTPCTEEKVLLDYGRDQIARERAMRLPLTAEICERLGMAQDRDYRYLFFKMDVADFREIISAVASPDGRVQYVRLRGLAVAERPTVGHLFAAALLAGVTLDWRKVGK